MSITHHSVILVKGAQRQLREKVIEGNLSSLMESINTKSLAAKGWTLEGQDVSHFGGVRYWRQRYPTTNEREKYQDPEYVYELHVRITFAPKDNREPGKLELGAIVRTLHSRASQPNYGKWTVASVDGDAYTPPENGEGGYSTSDMLGYAEVTIPQGEEWDENFAHLYGLDSAIFRVKAALEQAQASGWKNRFHVALVGPPGCGKSDICQSVKRALGEDAVLEFDATATTAAGAIKELAEREILPRVLVVEEIEKADEKSMSFLLALCDTRGEIRKTTARSTIQRDTKMLVIATVNDIPLFEKLQANALASRFSANKVHFRRPGRETFVKILKREIGKLPNGNEAWIDPALDYAFAHGITDPRAIIGLCLCGGDDLLTGKYQRMLDETSAPEE